MFTLYINDLANLQLTEGFKVVAYADDLLKLLKVLLCQNAGRHKGNHAPENGYRRCKKCTKKCKEGGHFHYLPLPLS